MILEIDRKAWQRTLDQIDPNRLAKIIDKVIYKAGFDMEKKIVENIIRVDAVNTGTLLQGWGVDPVPGEQAVKVATNVEYAADVEYGTAPHTAPLDALVEWAHKKFQLSDKEARNVGAKVWQKIKEKGTKGRAYLTDAVESFDRMKYIAMIWDEWKSDKNV